MSRSETLGTDPVIILVGPTAVGKTALSISLAREFDCEIVSVDSMQVYKYMDIGTAKANQEERAGIPHHLIDIVTPDVEYNAQRFAEDAERAIRGIRQRGKIPLLTGGTGLYLRALTQGFFDEIGDFHDIRKTLEERADTKGLQNLYQELLQVDPGTAERVHPNDRYRILRGLEIYMGTGIPWSSHIAEQQKNRGVRFQNLLQLGLTTERKRLYSRINLRTGQMLRNGFEEEVRKLLSMGYSSELKSMQSIGYRHMLNHISGEWDAATTEELLARDTRRYAKRQYTWFNRMEIEWFQADAVSGIFKSVSDFISNA